MKHELEKIQWGVIPITNYRGVMVERLRSGFRVLGEKVKTPQEVDAKINSANQSLKNSIK